VEVEEMDFTIKVTNEFMTHPSHGPFEWRVPKEVLHVDVSRVPQFTAKEERVIGIN
jgi:hypothetical protein